MIVIAVGAVAGALTAAPAIPANADDAPQPVIVLTTYDPENGSNAVGTGTTPWAASITIPDNYEIEMTQLSFPIYVLNPNKGAYEISVSLYSDDDGKPGALYEKVGTSSRKETPNPIENEVIEGNLNNLSGITLHAGTTYWLAFSGNVNIALSTKARPHSDYGLTSTRDQRYGSDSHWYEVGFRPIFEIQGRLIPVTKPTISSDTSSPSSSDSVTWKVGFDTPISGLAAENFTLHVSGRTQASITSVKPTGEVPAKEWTVTASAREGDGSLGLAMTSAPARTVINNLPTSGGEVTIDKTSPAVSIASSAGSRTDLTTIPVTISWDERTSELDPSSVQVANGTFAPGAAPGDANVAVIPDKPGPVTITVLADSVKDAAGNPNRKSTWSVDFVPTRVETASGSVAAGQVYRTQLTSPSAGSATYSLFSVPDGVEASLDGTAGTLAITTSKSTALGVHSLTVLIESEGHAYLKTLALDVGPAASSLAQTGAVTGGVAQAALILLVAGAALAAVALYRRRAKAVWHQPDD